MGAKQQKHHSLKQGVDQLTFLLIISVNLDHNNVSQSKKEAITDAMPCSHHFGVLAPERMCAWARVFWSAYWRACEWALGAWAWRVWALAWALGVGRGRWAWALGVGVGVAWAWRGRGRGEFGRGR